MRKILLSLSCVIIVLTSFSQDYSCIKDDGYLYIRPDKHFEGIHIDSAKMMNGDSMLFFHPIVDENYNFENRNLKNAWIGKKAKISNYNTIFFNNINDSIIIKSKAKTSDEWFFYKNAIKAKILKIDTMTVFNGVLDSIKIIGLIKIESTIPDSINGKEIILSKNYGLLSFLNITSFEGKSFEKYQKYLQKIPTEFDFYKYEEGDIFQWQSSYLSYPTSISYDYKTDTITKVIRNSDSIIYQISCSNFSCTNYLQFYYGPEEDYCNPKTNSTKTLVIKRNYISPSYPFEEVDFNEGGWYSLFLDSLNRLNYLSDHSFFESSSTLELIEGVGIKQSSNSRQDIPNQGTTSSISLHAYKKINGEKYGTFASANESTITNTISLYPNPCNGSFNIDMPLEIDRFTLSIINNNGSILQNMEYYNEGSNLIDISNLSAGFYTIRILTDSETFFKRIVVY